MDVVHVHHPFLSGTLALLYCRSRGIPIIFTNHTRYDLYTQAYLPVMPDVVGNAALQAYLTTFCRTCDLVISPSAGMREVLRELGVDVPIDVVPNGVDLRPFQDPDDPIRRASLGFEPEDVVLIFIGRLGPEKNVPFLVRSFAGAIQANEHLRLVLIGDGPERGNLEDRIERSGLNEQVKLLGSLPYQQVPRYMAMADAFVTASVTEVHPLTVIEAMAAGLPVLGICSPGIADTIEDGKTGYLVQQEDLAMFTAKMILLGMEGEARRRMGMNARLTAEQYSIERTTKLMLERYRLVVQQSAHRKRTWRARLQRAMDRLGR
jgi:glycosyltransferase involved in cell wall biosynthesis